MADIPLTHTKLMRNYLDEVLQAYGYIQELDQAPSDRQTGIPIQRMFVEPGLSQRRITFDQIDKTDAPIVSLVQAIKENRQLTILGDPGSGKSTIVKWIATNLADPGSNVFRTHLGDLVPLVFILRELRLPDNVTPESLQETFLESRVGASLSSGNYLHELMLGGNAFVMFDGLDEISSPEVRQQIGDCLATLAKVYDNPLNRWLLTSRIVGYEDNPWLLQPRSYLKTTISLRDQKLIDCQVSRGEELISSIDPSEIIEIARRLYGRDHLTEDDLRYSDDVLLAEAFKKLRTPSYFVAPFQEHQRDRFIDNWYYVREPYKKNAEEGANDFKKALKQRQDLTEISSNPQLLTLMCLVHRIQTVLPHGRAKLYEELAKVYLETIPRNRKLEIPYPIDFNLKCLSRFGFEMQRLRASQHQEEWIGSLPKIGVTNDGRGGILVTSKQLEGWFNEEAASSSIPHADFIDALNYITRRGGLLNDPGDGLYSFLHLSIQEYFAALYISNSRACMPAVTQDDAFAFLDAPSVSQISAEDLVSWAKLDIWHETFRLLFQILPDNLSRFALSPLFGSFQNIWEGCLSLTKRIESDLECLYDLLAAIVADRFSNLAMPLRAHCVFVLLKAKRDLEYHQGIAIDIRRGELSFNSVMLVMSTIDWNGSDPRISDLLASWTKLSLYSTPTSDVSALTSLDNLKELRLVGTRVSDVSALASLTRLQTLDLRATPVSDVSALSCLSSLKELYLSFTPISDISALASLTGLQVLDLLRTEVSDVYALSSLSSLRELHLSVTQVSDVSALASLANLQTLYLSNTQVSDVSALASLVNLKTLDLSGTQVSDVSALASLSSLKLLHLSGTQVSDVSALASLANLQTLYLSNTQVSDVSALASLANIDTLNLSGTQVSDVSALASLVNLKTLDLFNTPVSDVSMLTHVKYLIRDESKTGKKRTRKKE